jgi:hypothetical protein
MLSLGAQKTTGQARLFVVQGLSLLSEGHRTVIRRTSLRLIFSLRV